MTERPIPKSRMARRRAASDARKHLSRYLALMDSKAYDVDEYDQRRQQAIRQARLSLARMAILEGGLP